MNCAIAEQIAVMANEPDQRAASEIFSELRQNGEAWINGELVEMYRITDSINEEDYKEAGQESVTGNGDALYNLYIKTIEEF